MNKNFTKSAVSKGVLMALFGTALMAQSGFAAAYVNYIEGTDAEGVDACNGTNNCNKDAPLTVIGTGAKGYGVHAMAIGGYTQSGYMEEIANADGSTTTRPATKWTMVVGTKSSVLATGATLIGLNSNIYQGSESAVGLGRDLKIYGANSVALGYGVNVGTDKALTNDAVVIGSGAKAQANTNKKDAQGNTATDITGEQSVVIGTGAKSQANGAIVIGYKADTRVDYNSDAKNSITIGYTAYNRTEDSIVLGTNSSTGTTADHGVVLGSQSYVHAADGVLIGYTSSVSDKATHGVVLGSKSQVVSENGIAIGYDTGVSGKDSVSIGTGARSSAANSVALGANSLTSEANSISVGGYKDADGNVVTRKITNVTAGVKDTDAVNVSQLKAATDIMAGDGTASNGGKAIGNGSSATGLQSFAVGTNGTIASGDSATAVGYQAQALGIQGTALGRSAYVGTGAQNSTAIGGKANVADNVKNSVALGYNSNVKSSGAIAIGEDSAVDEGATDSTAVGLGAKTAAKGATALGARAQSLSADSIAIGNGTHAQETATQSVVIGSSSYSNAEGAVTLGYKARVSQTTSTHGVALGYDTEVKGASGIAIGYKAGVDGENSVSIGTDAHSPFANSVALGANSVTTQADSVSIGTSGKTRTITYVTAGVNDTDAVNVKQLKDSQTVVAAGTGVKVTSAKDTATGATTYTVSVDGNAGAGSVTFNQGDNNNITVSQDATTKAYTVKLGDDANAAVNNAKKLGDAASVNDGIKGDTVVDSINNLDDKVGDQQYKNVTAKDVANGMSATEAIGALNNKVGDLSQLDEGLTGDTVVDAINSVNGKVDAVDTKVGDLSKLNSGLKGDSVVDAINSVDSKIGDLSALPEGVKANTVAGALSNLNNKIGDAAGAADAAQKAADAAAAEAKKHTSASAGTSGNVTVTKSDTANASGGADYVIDLAKDITVDSVTVGENTKIEDGKVTVGDITIADGKITGIDSLEADSVKVGDVEIKDGKISGLSDGTADSDAATVAQVKAATSKVSAGSNIEVTPTTNADKSTTYQVALAKDISVDSVTATSGTIGGVAMSDGTITTGDTVISGTSVKVGDSELKTDSLKVNGKEYITADGINANEQKITNLAAGDITSAGSTDAVTGGQLYQTNQQVQANTDNIADLYKRNSDLNKKINRTGANAAALAALHPLDFDENHKVSASAGIGQYHGTGALAVGVFVRPTENLMFNIGGAFASSDRMFNAGVSYRFGDNGAKPVATNAQMADRVNALTSENRDLKAQLDASNTQVKELRSQIEAIKAKIGLK